MKHTCPTGNHRTPAYTCYSHHGCRCDGCREDKVARNRYDRWGGDVPADTGDWRRQLDVAEAIEQLTERLDRLETSQPAPAPAPVRVVRHVITDCDCDDDVEPLPERFDAAPLVELVEGRRRPLAELFHDDSLLAAFYRARKTGTLTLDAADRLSIALGHTIETIWTTDSSWSVLDRR